jgi:dynein heavy chain
MAKLAGMEAELRGNTERRARLEVDIALCSVKLVRGAELARGLVSSACAWCSSRP